MSFLDQSTTQKFPFSFEDVYGGLLEVLPKEGFSIKDEDKLIGRITASAGMSMFSWGENLSLSVQKVDEDSCIVGIDSSLKLGGNFTGTHRHQKNFDKIIMSLSKYLQSQ